MTYEQLLGRMHDLHQAKDRDYSGAVPYANFQRCEAIGVPAYVGCYIRMADKWHRVTELLRRELAGEGGPAVADEQVADTLLDLANYALITYLLYVQRSEEVLHGASG